MKLKKNTKPTFKWQFTADAQKFLFVFNPIRQKRVGKSSHPFLLQPVLKYMKRTNDEINPRSFEST